MRRTIEIAGILAVFLLAPGIARADDIDDVKAADRRVLVIRLSAGGQTTRCSSKTLNSILFTDTLSVAKYFSENSHGLLTMSGDVVGPYTIRLSSADDIGKSGSRIAIARAADSAASAAGVNLSAYTDYVYMLPPYTSRLGGSLTDPPRVWMVDAYCDAKHILGHEIGHLVGATHAGTPGSGNASTYGDASTTMGGLLLPADPSTLDLWNSNAHFNAPEKISEGWLTSGNVQTVTVGGSYKVAYLEAKTTEVQVLHIGTEYFSYRRAVGFDADLRIEYVENTSVHTWSGGTNDTKLRANIRDGVTYVNASVAVTQTAHDATYAYYTIAFGGTPPLDKTPPSAPTNMEASTCCGKQGITVDLTWAGATDNVGATGYKIFRNGVQIAISATDSYTDATTQAGGGTYTYYVQAFDAAGNVSVASDTASIVR